MTTAPISASPPHAIALEDPRPDGQHPIMDAFRLRRTTRAILDEPLPLPLLGMLLWAAWGVNRTPDHFGSSGRTAASASNSQEIDLFVALERGLYRYNAPEHRLDGALAGDYRGFALNMRQAKHMRLAPVQLIFIADVHRLVHTTGYQEPGLHDPEVQRAYYYVDTGMIAANVYLFAAAHGLAAWFHTCDRQALSQKLNLFPDQHVLFAQSVGYPAQE